MLFLPSFNAKLLQRTFQSLTHYSFARKNSRCDDLKIKTRNMEFLLLLFRIDPIMQKTEYAELKFRLHIYPRYIIYVWPEIYNPVSLMSLVWQKQNRLYLVHL